MISAPSASTWAMIVGDGGAAAVEMISGRSSGSCGAVGWLTRAISTVGAAQKWVTPALCISSPDIVRIELAQADVGAADGGDGPGVAPAIAVEHRQRPEIDAVG